MNTFPDRIDWDKGAGLAPAIVQDAVTGRILMLGYMNREALEKTLSSGQVTFYSRSRQCLWVKGETSGNTLEFVTQEVDCDGDAILIQAAPAGPTCHLDRASCFDRDHAVPGFGFVGRLEGIIEERMRSQPDDSYTARLSRDGISRIAQKIGEESVELALAAVQESRADTVSEAADLLFHLLVLLHQQGMTFAEIAHELQSRHRP